ncbi:hypothetical protein NST54_05050 [Caldifermentibacillus hisashii]|uniref:hypothetical protein n=1 Tax=Caldifermentibacillus hisashii TaxID=996558 RepID=UPI0034D4822D
MATSLILVIILRRKRLNFGDEPHSRRHFEVKNAQFWRRALFSSLFWAKNPLLYR